MSFQDFMNKVRYLDNKMAKWMMRHFYILFFEFLLVFVFFFFFVNVIDVINVKLDQTEKTVTEHLLYLQTVTSLIIVFLLLLNSFWMLYVFNSINRIRSVLREIYMQLSQQRK